LFSIWLAGNNTAGGDDLFTAAMSDRNLPPLGTGR
jgi:hypothetical protein